MAGAGGGAGKGSASLIRAVLEVNRIVRGCGFSRFRELPDCQSAATSAGAAISTPASATNPVKPFFMQCSLVLLALPRRSDGHHI